MSTVTLTMPSKSRSVVGTSIKNVPRCSDTVTGQGKFKPVNNGSAAARLHVTRFLGSLINRGFKHIIGAGAGQNEVTLNNTCHLWVNSLESYPILTCGAMHNKRENVFDHVKIRLNIDGRWFQFLAEFEGLGGGKLSWSDRPDRDMRRDATQCTGVLNTRPRGTGMVARYVNGNGQNAGAGALNNFKSENVGSEGSGVRCLSIAMLKENTSVQAQFADIHYILMSDIGSPSTNPRPTSADIASVGRGLAEGPSKCSDL
ncbi:hypothetical protein C8R44DRAFT_752314 [Mycena epipterygia]|nr:hypothetical protein C8R44DRAFT_752314 [Mycena epipterygia]